MFVAGRFSGIVGVDGRNAAASAAHDVVVKLNFHHDDGELSYEEADDVEDEVAVANEDNIALCS